MKPGINCEASPSRVDRWLRWNRGSGLELLSVPLTLSSSRRKSSQRHNVSFVLRAGHHLSGILKDVLRRWMLINGWSSWVWKCFNVLRILLFSKLRWSLWKRLSHAAKNSSPCTFGLHVDWFRFVVTRHFSRPARTETCIHEYWQMCNAWAFSTFDENWMFLN